jgi:hypothetical protein
MTVGRHVGKLAMALAILLVAGSALYAKDSQTLTLAREASLGSTKFEPGNYKVTWEKGASDSAVTFKQGKKVVATAQGKWVKRDAKYDSNAVVYSQNADGSRSISEIRFAGSDEVLVFGEDTTAQATAGSTSAPAAKGQQINQ